MGITHCASWVLIVFLGLSPTLAIPPEEIQQALSIIRSVGPEGQGNAPASQAWRTVAATETSQLPLLLAGMDGASPLAANWIRAAVETVVARQVRDLGQLPLSELGRFLSDPSHHPGARRLAFELIRKAQPGTAAWLVPGMLNDPSLELRREAVQRLLDEAQVVLTRSNSVGAILLCQQALVSARDIDQLQAAAERLQGLGQKVDLPRLFGFLLHWKVIGPFDNTKGTGFQTAFPPENAIDLAATCDGKSGPVQWQAYFSTNAYGKVDFNQACGLLKEVTAYAYTEFVSDQARPVELRLGCKNAWKVWLNGELLFGRDEYHRGAEIDQYRMPAQLSAGRNIILVKACQNEMREDWTVEWEFQLRVCDSLGTAVRPSAPPSFVGADQPQPARRD